MSVRSFEFYNQNILNTLTSSDFTALATGYYNSSYAPENAFITSKSKIGSRSSTEWLNNVITNQRLIIVFNVALTFDTIVFNNSHSSGGAVEQGVKTTEITVSPNEITETTFGAAVSGGTVIFDGTLPIHPSTNTAHDYEIPLTI